MSNRPTMLPILDGLTCGESYCLIALAGLVTGCTFFFTNILIVSSRMDLQQERKEASVTKMLLQSRRLF
jgi:hypothetical protein